jgi:hypothetical protein
MATDADEITRHARELEEAELYELQLRAQIVRIRDELAAGRVARALSLCNATLTEIDNQADVVAPSPEAKSQPE